MFKKASMSSGAAIREEAVGETMRRRKFSEASRDSSGSGSGEPSPDKGEGEGWKYPNKKLKGEGSRLDEIASSLGSVFDNYKVNANVRAQAEADEAAAKKLEAEAKRDKARAKLLEAQASSDMHLLAQIEKLTAMAESAEKNENETAAKTYRAKIAKLEQQLLDS